MRKSLGIDHFRGLWDFATQKWFNIAPTVDDSPAVKVVSIIPLLDANFSLDIPLAKTIEQHNFW